MPEDGSPELVEVTVADRADDAGMLVYGLKLRGVHAVVRRVPGRNPYSILVSRTAEPVAKASIAACWDAILDSDRAMTAEGNCPFCGYRVIEIPLGNPCPECGTHLSSLEVRKIYRSGRAERDDPARPD